MITVVTMELGLVKTLAVTVISIQNGQLAGMPVIETMLVLVVIVLQAVPLSVAKPMVAVALVAMRLMVFPEP